MGLLSEGTPLTWSETQKYCEHVRQHGIRQFISLYRRLKNRTKDSLKWGDEVEYQLVRLTQSGQESKPQFTAQLSLAADSLLPELQREEIENAGKASTLWRPEYASYMVEGVPGEPYGHLLAHLNLVEANMRKRRAQIQSLLPPDTYALTLTAFPRLGCPEFCFPPAEPTPDAGVSCSAYLPDAIIYQGHPRFKTLTRNIRERRSKKVAINIPVYRDVNTPEGLLEPPTEHTQAALPGHIYMDAMGFGMGCCCLQMTFQACSISEAYLLYDQLTPLSPVLLALSAASPVHRGWLADTDTRWRVISGAVDCRTDEELGLKPLQCNRFRIAKSRYDSIDSYLSAEGQAYNDIPLTMDEDILRQLTEAGVETSLSRHLAHLFIRDPVSLFSEKINQSDTDESDHFENIQSTNWQSMRFKPPPTNSTIGWRVEFRCAEVQLTDFENAAYVVFIVLLTRVLLTLQIDLLMPISKGDGPPTGCTRPDIAGLQPTEFETMTTDFNLLNQLHADDLFDDLFDTVPFSPSGEYHLDPQSDPASAVINLDPSVPDDKEAQELLDELMADDEVIVVSVQEAQYSWNATSQPNLPMIEPQQQPKRHRRPQELQKKPPQKLHLLEQPPSPTAVSSCSYEGGSDTSLALVSPAREAEIDEMVTYIKDVIERSSNCKPDEMSSKLKVHEVILTILLNSSYGDRSKDLRRILTFCDENGRETAGECRHFKTLDTETMGLLWQKIKGNKKANYDTFARAMRVRREKSRGYFDYLDSGKRSKKRIYRFGEKSMADMDRMKRTLRLLSVPQDSCF